MTLDAFIHYVILPLLGGGIVLAFVRLVRGPSLPDRVVALDLMATLIIALSAAYAVATGQHAYLDAAIVLALITFLGTVAFAYYLHRRDGGA
ncbi:cation:proton antiporter [Geobacter sulfurreducens]|uniref:Sodium/proton antiporter complex Mrp, protein F n=1 Tax=Geobacter sulfurreducens (strain ATCC 51573 / DSM 12127 / PCA) TaxID=243231 RepID=Q74AL4_GEOSL|nr:cation:proton antiporter [Geobacter sulfurreducens]AAR35714.1 sodium/proton antiporter complex Mrp, protein F [Geobacter sulfurreducens PCA]UAC03046.1 cation:proton antiporter [Geobacter sulfurreducens]BBA70780.1 Na(+)/H(+) antiporter subunit F [Geobacter sulfurreducens]HBB68885.1 cation:proton antiporter [Geobacter sulfurreducens]HCD95099.1 cation:proton antiporter [Geobacter sulfurreducens]